MSLLATLSLLAAPSAQAATGPEWKLTVTPNADYFHPGDVNLYDTFRILAQNVGDQPTSGEITLENTLPKGLTPKQLVLIYSGDYSHPFEASSEPTALKRAEQLCPTFSKCEFPGPQPYVLAPGQFLEMIVHVEVAKSAKQGSITDKAKVSGGGAPTAEAGATVTLAANPPFAIDSFAPLAADSSGAPYTQAGGHPYQLSTELDFASATSTREAQEGICTANTLGRPCPESITPTRDPRDVRVGLPPGLIGNPGAVPRCVLASFFNKECPLSTAIGAVGIAYDGSSNLLLNEIAPLYNLVPSGSHPAELGFISASAFLFIASVRSGSDYGIDTLSAASPEAGVYRVDVVLWGVPAEASHDGLRGKTCLRGAVGPDTHARSLAEAFSVCSEMDEGSFGNGGPAGVAEPHAFLTMPTACTGEALSAFVTANSWQLPEETIEKTMTMEPVGACNQLSFEPDIQAHPTTDLADSPSGLEFDLHMPDKGLEDPNGRSESDIKDAVAELPLGVTVNPAAATGLTACSPQQIEMSSDGPGHCPESSKIGTVEIESPLANEKLEGGVYEATPGENPFGSTLAFYTVAEAKGLVIKLPAEVVPDPQTGQLETIFRNNPQLPFSHFRLHFFAGARGVLRTPPACGPYTTTATLTPYSAPESGPPAEPSSSFETTAAAQEGESCPPAPTAQPNAPAFRAATESPQAGAFSPFSFKLARADGSQELSKIETTLPPGLVGKLAGISECSDAQLALAQGREHEGGGEEEQANPSCPLSSEVGTVEVAAGAGPTPLYVTGHAYLAGPYKNAPLSLAIITPALAGPFDLGDVLVRTALYVDPATAQIKAVSDPIPHILQGIPLDVRSITLRMSRHEFTLNPTNCEALGFTGNATSVLGAIAPLSQRFQVGGCQSLPFKPKLSLAMSGSTKRTGDPALKAVLTMPPGSANIARAQVTLPRGELVDNAHIGNVCARSAYLAGTCSPTSEIGHAQAVTPLLAAPLEGPVYLVSGFAGHQLPDVAADLGGQIRVLLHGKTDSVHESLRNTFEVVPDAPVSKFTLSLDGGRKGLIENSHDLCSVPHKALALFAAQSGKQVELNPLVKVRCHKHKRGKGHRRHRRR